MRDERLQRLPGGNLRIPVVANLIQQLIQQHKIPPYAVLIARPEILLTQTNDVREKGEPGHGVAFGVRASRDPHDVHVPVSLHHVRHAPCFTHRRLGGESIVFSSSSSSPARPRGARARLRGAWIQNLTSKRIHDVSLDLFAIRAREEDITAEIDDEQSAQGVTGDRRGRHGVDSSTRASIDEDRGDTR